MKGLGPKQIAILELMRKKKKVTTQEVASLYGYKTLALSALKGLEIRGYIKMHKTEWTPGERFAEVFR